MHRFIRFAGLSILFGILALTSTVSAQTSGRAFTSAGEWRSGAIDGVYSDPQQPGCTYFTFVERILLISLVPGSQTEIRGLWRRHAVSVWINNLNSVCKWPELSSPADSFESTFIYAIDGAFEPLTQKIEFGTSYKNCFGNGCAAAMKMAGARQKIKQVLQVRGNALVDTSLSAQQTIVFLRTADAVELEIDAKKSAADYEKTFDEERGDELIRNDFSSDALRDTSFSLDGLKQFKERVGRIVLRVPLAQLYACLWTGRPAETAKLVLLVQHVQAADNRQGLEFMVLRQEDGQWKMDAFLFR